MENKMGPRMDPRRTPHGSGADGETEFPRLIEKIPVKQIRAEPIRCTAFDTTLVHSRE